METTVSPYLSIGIEQFSLGQKKSRCVELLLRYRFDEKDDHTDVGVLHQTSGSMARGRCCTQEVLELEMGHGADLILGAS